MVHYLKREQCIPCPFFGGLNSLKNQKFCWLLRPLMIFNISIECKLGDQWESGHIREGVNSLSSNPF